MKLATQLLQELHGVWPGIVETSSLSVDDDLSANRLILHFVYEIADCWKREPSKGRWEFNIADHFTTKELAIPKSTRRNSEIFLGRPRTVVWRARVQMPRRWGGRGWRNVSGERGAVLRNDLTIDSRTVILERALVIDDWTLPADRAEAYARLVFDISRNAAKLYARTFFGRLFSVPGVLSRRALWVGLVIICWLLIAVLPSMCSGSARQSRTRDSQVLAQTDTPERGVGG